MTYGRKLKKGDSWYVRDRKVTWRGGHVLGRCGVAFDAARFANYTMLSLGCAVDDCLTCEAECIAQQMIAEGMLPGIDGVDARRKP